MKYSELRKKTQIRASITVIALIATVTICIYVSNIKNSTLQHLRQEKNATIQQQSKLQRLLQQKKEFADSIKLWKQLNEDSKSLTGLQIDESKQILKQLEKKYRLSNTSFVITPPQELPNLYKNDTTTVISSTIKLSFETITDEIAFSFINELSETLPGYIKITSLKMERHGELTDNVVKKLYNGTAVGLVKTNLSFNWRDIKNINPPNNNKLNNL